MPCVFCRIVDGDAPSRTVLAMDTVRAFLDANPLAPGHTLVIPTAHHERLAEVPTAVAADLGAAVRRVAPAAETAVDADATTVAINDGRAAGQEVPHVHWHVVPRFAGDGAGPIHRLFGSRPSLTDGELDGIADRIAEEIEL